MPSSGCGDAALVRTFGVEEELLPVDALTGAPAAAAEGLTGILRNGSGSRRNGKPAGAAVTFPMLFVMPRRPSPAVNLAPAEPGMRERTGSRNIRGYPD
jgi:hypothetical protein